MLLSSVPLKISVIGGFVGGGYIALSFLVGVIIGLLGLA